MSLQMEKGLIVREYEQAKNKNAQVEILADLNGCDVSEIMNVLIEAGVISGMPGAKKKKSENVKWTPELDAEVSKLAREGLKLNEIAERLGMNKQCIYDRRKVLKKQAERLAGDLEAKEKKERILPQPLRDSSLREGASKKEKSHPNNKDELTMLCDTDASTTPKTTRELRAEALGCGVLREIIEMLKSVGLEVTECSINLLERTFIISGIEKEQDL